MLSGRGLCVGLITGPEESYRVFVCVQCDGEASTMRRPWRTAEGGLLCNKNIVDFYAVCFGR